MADEVLGHRRLGARRDTVALDDAVLHVRGRDRQAVSRRPSGREALPHVLGVRRGVRPAVHPDDAIVATEHAFERVGDQLVRDRIDALVMRMLGPGPRMKYTRRMRLRHSFRQSEDRRVPVRRLLPRGVVDGQTGVVAELGAGSAMRLVLVDTRCPFTGDVDLLLRERRRPRSVAEPDQGLDDRHGVVSPRANGCGDED